MFTCILCRPLGLEVFQIPPVDSAQALHRAEIRRPQQGGRLGQFYSAALLKQSGDKLGAEVIPLPVERQVEMTGQSAQQAVVVNAAQGVHGPQLVPEPAVGGRRHRKGVQTAGDVFPTQPPAAVQLFLNQSGRQGEPGVFSAEAVKGSHRPLQADGGVRVVVSGGQMDDAGKTGPGAGK